VPALRKDARRALGFGFAEIRHRLKDICWSELEPVAQIHKSHEVQCGPHQVVNFIVGILEFHPKAVTMNDVVPEVVLLAPSSFFSALAGYRLYFRNVAGPYHLRRSCEGKTLFRLLFLVPDPWPFES